MSNRLVARLRKVEGKLKPERKVVVFEVRNTHKEKDFQRQYDEYISNGGDPNAIFVSIKNYGESEADT